MGRQSGIPVSQSLLRLMTGLACSLLLLTGLMYVVERSGSEVNLSRVFESLRGIPLEILMLYTLVVVTNTLARTVRYRLLVDANARASAPRTRFIPLFIVTAVRNMVVDLLPARIGELIFVAMLKRVCQTPAGTGLAAVALSLLLDIVILIPLLLLVAFVPLTGPALRQGSLPAAFLLIAVSVVVAVLLWPGLRIFVRWFHTQTIAWSWMRRPMSLLFDTSDALVQCRRSGVLGPALAMTVVIRLLKYGGLLLLFHAVVTSPGMTGVAAGVIDVVVALIAAEVGASVPVPTLMSFGAYEAGGAAAFVLLGYPLAAAVMVLLTVHIASQILDYTFGGICLVLFFLIGAGTAGSQEDGVNTSGSRWSLGYVAVATIALLIAVALSVYQLNRIRSVRSQVGPPAGEAIAIAPGASGSLPEGLQGWVVWSSNRYGNHDILRMRLGDRHISRLTKHPHTETFPRISPNGSQIVFMRSRVPWVSLRDLIHWDTYLLEVKSGRERLLAEFAGAPTWSGDGKSVFFQRRGVEFVEHDLSSGEERVRFRSGTGGLPEGVQLYEPSLSADLEQLAVTWRGSRRMTAIVDAAGSVRATGGGCQLTWAPDDRFVYWIDDGGAMQNQVYRRPATGQSAEPWLDLPVPYSHEYFPRLSRDGRYLVLGASAGGHEHDVADYEIFVWPVGSPASQAVRLTFHSGNDNWPDIFTD